MANTSVIYVRVDSDLKEGAEKILSQLGISPSSAIQMFYSQILLHKGVPFELKLPEQGITAIGSMSREQLDSEPKKGLDSLKEGSYTISEVDALMAKNTGYEQI